MFATTTTDGTTTGASTTTTGAATTPPTTEGGAASVTTGSPTTTTAPTWWRPITPDRPLRVWVLGDSLAGPLGRALAARTQAAGLLTVVVDAREGTGLVRDDWHNWPAYATERLRELDPEVVVCVIGANDGQAFRSGGGRFEFGTPEWDQEYAARIARFMDLLGGESRRLYWVSVPIMADPDYDQRVRHINARQREQAAARRGPVYIDAYALFQDPAGEFAARLPDESGEMVTVRLPDGVHFTEAGADLLARQVLRVLGADWGLDPPPGD